MTAKKMGRGKATQMKNSGKVNATPPAPRIQARLASAARRVFLPMNIAGWRAKCWICRKICREKFFNIDASREIDRLTIELEKLRAEGTR